MKKILFIISFIACLLIVKQAFADPQVALNFIKQRHQSMITSKSNIGLEIDRILDYDRVIKDSMGSNWNLASDSQKQDIGRLLKVIIKKSLEKRLDPVKSRKVKWLHSEDVGNGVSIVKSVVEPKKSVDEPLEVDYIILNDENGVRVIDVMFEGVSTIYSYKRQFDKVIKKQGVDSLIDKLNNKVISLELDEDDGC